MTDNSAPNSNDELMKMMMQQMLQNNQSRSGPGFLLGVIATVLVLAAGVGGTAAFFMLTQDDAPRATSVAEIPAATTSGFVPAQITPEPAFPPPTTFAQPNTTTVPTATLGGTGNARIAQSVDRQIYAFEPTSGLAFRFVVGGGAPLQIASSEIPADVREQLLAGGQAPTASVVDPAALAAQASRAQTALTQQATTDVRRPPINQLLQSDTDSVAQVITALDRAQGIIRPASAEGDETPPTVYAFFDPRCPYCHLAYNRMDGEFTVKWLPISVFGPDGEDNHAHLMGATEMGTTEVDGETLDMATMTDAPDVLSARLDEYMSVEHNRFRVPRGTELSEAHGFILGENAELFRLLSQGAEELRAVPSFFIVQENGNAVWLRGYDADNDNRLISDIIAGNAS